MTVLVLVASSCASGSPLEEETPDGPAKTTGTSSSEREPTTTEDSSESEEGRGPTEIDRPPPVEVRGGDTVLSLEAWTACWGNGCYDGMPPQNPPHIGDPAEILVEFPEEGWEFSATVTPVGEECGRRQTEPLETVEVTVHRLMPIGLADEYEVTLFGRGPGGDLFVSFLWSTPTDGVMPVPAATVSILADHDGQLDSYGVEVPVWNLAATPEQASGRVTVRSAEGEEHTFQLARQDQDCSEGTLYFTAPTAEGLTAAGLGTAPFTYELTLGLDGQTHVGTGVWPDQVDPECAPCVPLSFTPPLPALTANNAEGVQPVKIALAVPSMSEGLTNTSQSSSWVAPTNSPSRRIPSTSTRDATYSLATRFIPSASGEMTMMSAPR